MYEELVSELREKAEFLACAEPLHIKNAFAESMKQAADAIERMEKALEDAKEYESFWEKEANEALRKFQVAVASKPRWICVDERLPESDQRVIYHTTEGAVEIGKYKPEFSVFTQGEIFAWIRRDAVTHWMPLPEPPKEETE